MHNAVVDALKNVVARLSLLRDGFSIKILYNSSVLDNISNLHIFNDD